MYLDDMIEEMQSHLGNDNDLTDEILESCIKRAVKDLSRSIPRRLLQEYELSFDVTDEDWTTGSTLTTAVTLANTNIKPASYKVESTDGATTYVDGTDYTINCVTGVITPIAAALDGTLEASTEYHISYSKLKIGLDISDIIADVMEIKMVEYPAGNTPQEFVSHQLWGSYLYLLSPKTGSQIQLSAGKRIVVYYDAEHTMNTDSSDGTWPSYLDDVVMLGAEGYALEAKSRLYTVAAGTVMGNGQAYLDTGEPKIDALNKGGASVGPTYGQYAQIASAMGATYNDSANRSLQESVNKLNLFWSILKDKSQVKAQNVLTPTQQGMV
jgi:hypothetical protein